MAYTIPLESVVIGYVLSTAPLYIKNQFGESPYTVGLLLTASQSIAMAFILLVEYLDKNIKEKLRKCQ